MGMESRPVVEYYFSVISSYSYLGNAELHRIADKHNAVIVYKPVNVDDLFSASGGVPVNQRSTQRQAYRLLEIERWSKFRDRPLNRKPKYHPADATMPHRVLLAGGVAGGGGKPTSENQAVRDFVELAMRAVWAEERDISDSATVGELAEAAGLPGELVEQVVQEKEIAARERGCTTEAIQRQLFGLPTYVVAGEPFWGQDRLGFLESMLASGRKPMQLPEE
ncbi:hypothetical protein PWT90_10458 [Aphanocladium album]|nr:hypothetical protein PWT90_10458 [Aphanocladium album]